MLQDAQRRAIADYTFPWVVGYDYDANGQQFAKMGKIEFHREWIETWNPVQGAYEETYYPSVIEPGYGKVYNENGDYWYTEPMSSYLNSLVGSPPATSYKADSGHTLTVFTNWDSQNPFTSVSTAFDDANAAFALLDTPLQTGVPKRWTVSKLQYKFQPQANAPKSLIWCEVFTPADASQPKEYNFLSWVVNGAAESPVYAIDPLAIDPADGSKASRRPSVSGTYTVEPVVPELTSRDKFFAGSIEVPAGLAGIELEFVNTSTGETLGRYGKLDGAYGKKDENGQTRIYRAVEEIMATDADIASLQSDAQQVWFVRSPVTPRKIEFYTCFNGTGNVEVRMHRDGQPIGAFQHTLTPADDFAFWITYADQWAKGIGFEFPDDPAPAGLRRSLAAVPPTPPGMSNLARAALIPIYLVIAQVEGLETVARGLFDGVKNGLLDDWETLKLIKTGALAAGGWAKQRMELEFISWRTDPKRRIAELKQLADVLVTQVAFQIVGAASDLSTWEGFKRRSLEAWNSYVKMQVRSYVLLLEGGQKLVDSLLAWGDDFALRMMRGGNETVFANTPWDRAAIAKDIVTTERQMAFTFGYTCGYLAEQLASGFATDGVTVLGKILIRKGLKLGGLVAATAALKVAAHMQLVKVALKDSLERVFIERELREAIERGIAKAGYTPVDELTKSRVTEVLGDALAREGFDRAAFNMRVVWEEVTRSPNLKRLLKSTGREEQFLHRFAIFHQTLGAEASEEASKGWLRAYERALKFDPNLPLVEDRIGDLFRVLGADSAEGKRLVRGALEEFSRSAEGQVGEVAFKIPGPLSRVFPELYNYRAASDFKRLVFQDGKLTIPEFSSGKYYLTSGKFDSSATAVSRLQLPTRSNVSAAERARFRFKIRTQQVDGKLEIPYGFNHLPNPQPSTPTGILEFVTRENPQLGIGNASQYTTGSAMVVEEVFDMELGRSLTEDEIRAIIQSVQT